MQRVGLVDFNFKSSNFSSSNQKRAAPVLSTDAQLEKHEKNLKISCQTIKQISLKYSHSKKATKRSLLKNKLPCCCAEADARKSQPAPQKYLNQSIKSLHSKFLSPAYLIPSKQQPNPFQLLTSAYMKCSKMKMAGVCLKFKKLEAPLFSAEDPNSYGEKYLA